jgi:hypothetical protein
LKQHKKPIVTSHEEKHPPRFSRVGGWAGSARKTGGIRDKFLLLPFGGVAGDRYSDLKIIDVMRHYIGKRKKRL